MWYCSALGWGPFDNRQHLAALIACEFLLCRRGLCGIGCGFFPPIEIYLGKR
jgi:hypothetical protein